MSTMPRFFIVAGPNGAGKSTLGQTFVPPSVSIFNGDLCLLSCVPSIPYTPQTIAHYTRLEKKLTIIISEVEWFNNQFKTPLTEMIKQEERENQSNRGNVWWIRAYIIQMSKLCFCLNGLKFVFRVRRPN